MVSQINSSSGTRLFQVDVVIAPILNYLQLAHEWASKDDLIVRFLAKVNNREGVFVLNSARSNYDLLQQANR